MYVADTHPLMWFLTGDDRLGKKAKKIFIKADKGETSIVVPTIVLAESLFIAEKNRVDVLKQYLKGSMRGLIMMFIPWIWMLYWNARS